MFYVFEAFFHNGGTLILALRKLERVAQVNLRLIVNSISDKIFCAGFMNSENITIQTIHFGEQMGDLTLDYYVLPGSLEKAKQLALQVKQSGADVVKIQSFIAGKIVSIAIVAILEVAIVVAIGFAFAENLLNPNYFVGFVQSYLLGGGGPHAGAGGQHGQAPRQAQPGNRRGRDSPNP